MFHNHKTLDFGFENKSLKIKNTDKSSFRPETFLFK